MWMSRGGITSMFDAEGETVADDANEDTGWEAGTKARFMEQLLQSIRDGERS